MSKHTPGPWQVNDSNPLQVCDCDGEIRGCAPIAHVLQTGYPKPRAEDIANARLIAAAPDLLAALKDAEFLMRKCGTNWREASVMHESMLRSAEDARAAIAKAEGR